MDSQDSVPDIYKYRRLSDRRQLLLDPPRGSNSLTQSSDVSLRNVAFAIEKKNQPKHYSVLQEPRTEFSNNKLREFLLVCSNPGLKLLTVISLFISYLLDTFIYTFYDPAERNLGIIIVIISLNFVFTFDVFILVGLKISKQWRKTLNLVETSNMKVLVDVVLAVPYSFFYLIPDESTKFDFCAIAPFAALLRIYRIIEYFYKKSIQAGSNQWTTFLGQYLILFLLAVHTWTCLWYFFSHRSFDLYTIRDSWSLSAIFLPTETTADWYFVCAYWSVMSITTNALGDLYPVTTIERIMAILAVVLGFTLTTVVFVGSLTSQFITMTTRRSKYVRQLNTIENHLRLIKMDSDTTKRIIRYYEDLWYQKSGVFKPTLMKLLPSPLQMEICYDLNAIPLYSSLLFRKLPEAFLRRLSLAMSHQFYLAGDIVYEHNQNKTIMICVTNGVLELLSDQDDESPMISFTKGTCFGEISLVYNIPARCTVKAATYVECQVLEKTKFIKLMITYPDIVTQIRKEINARINRKMKRKIDDGSSVALSLNIYASKDKKKSSIKCLKDKLRYIQGKIDEDKIKEDELDENCLDLYIIAEHVKKRTQTFTCLYGHFPWILDSECYLVKYWEIYMLINVFYISIAYPYFIGVMRVFPGGFFFFTQVAITVSLVLNIFITSCTAIKTKKKNITKFWDIMKYRMNTLGFYLDMIALVPLEYIVTIHSETMYWDMYRNHLFYMCKGIKLCLIWRLSNFFEKMEKKLTLNSLAIKISKYCIYICLLCYWCGIILYMEACFVSLCAEESWFSKAMAFDNQETKSLASKVEYPVLTSVYFATTLLLAVGYGDFYPGDTADMCFVAFLSLYGVLLIGYCISEFSAVVTHWSRTKTAFLEVIMTIDKFMKENNMHPAIKHRIMAFYELQWQYNSGVELTGGNWLQKTIVPTELRKKVLHQARFKALTSIKFFQVKNKAYIHTLTETARDIILPPGEIVYYGGTVSRELYIIESGYCLVTNKEFCESKKDKVIGPGNHLGLLVLLYGVPALSTVITLTHCKLISIGYSAYSSALSLFPDMREHEGLLTDEELHGVRRRTKNQDTAAHLRKYTRSRTQTIRITSILQEFLNDSFINVMEDYNSRKQSYWKSYKQFTILPNIAPYFLAPVVIKPDGAFLKAWVVLRVYTALLICLFTPLVVCMAPSSYYFNAVVVILECICYIDIYLKLHIAYYGDKNQLIYHPYMTAKNYLKRSFALDLLTSFPWYAVWKLFAPKHNEGHTAEDHINNDHVFHCAVRMMNVLQIYKVYSAFWAETIGALKRAYLMSVLQFLLLTLFFLNLYTCILIMISCRFVVAHSVEALHKKLAGLSLQGPYRETDFDPEGVMICQLGSWVDAAKFQSRSAILKPEKVYLLAYYWAASSFSGAGFGDITAQDTYHMILTIMIMIHGALFFGYVYAKIASLKAMADQVVTKYVENLKHLELFMNREHIPFTLKKSIMEYWKYQWKRTGGWSHQTILGKLHANLNEDAVLYMYEKTLREIPLFENVEHSFFRAFAKQLKEQYFQKGYMVMKANEVMHNMYIIYRGKVDIISDVYEVEACMGPGGIFGNIRGAYKFLSSSNVIASRNIDLLIIKGASFYALLKSYPTVYRKVMHSMGTAAKDYVIPTMMSERSFDNFSENVSDKSSSDEDSGEDIDEEQGLFFSSEPSPERSIADSHGSRSVMSISHTAYAAAAWLLFMPHKWFRCSVIPDCKWVTFMEHLILFLAYAEFMWLVYEMAFMSIHYFFYMCVVTDSIFMYKMFLDFHTGYMNRYGDYVLSPRKVRNLYFSKVSHRRRDFLANLPLCYLAFALNIKPRMASILFCYLRTPQLFRISYLFTYQTHRKINIGSANLFVKLTSIIIWASILSHVNACLFFKLSCLTPIHCTTNNWITKPQLNLKAKYSEGKYFSMYIAALWYIINLTTITGMGDVSSMNDFEIIETIISTIIIKFFTGLLISEMSAMMSAHASSLIAYDYGITELRDGLRDMDLSEHQMNKMWDYVRELWDRQQGRQIPELVHKLPYRFRCEFMQAAYGVHISQSLIFSKTQDDFKRMLCMWMRHCVFFPGNYIVQCGDSDQCLYFIHRGEVEVLTVHPNLTESIYDVLGPEDSFGIAQGLFVGIPHHFSFRARTVVDIIYLQLDQWKYLLDFYPNSARVVLQKVQNVYLAI